MRQEILIGPERRRRWSDGEKVSIVLEAAEADVSIAEVARRHDKTRQQIYQWRMAMRQGRPVDETGEAAAAELRWQTPFASRTNTVPPRMASQ